MVLQVLLFQLIFSLLFLSLNEFKMQIYPRGSEQKENVLINGKTEEMCSIN